MELEKCPACDSQLDVVQNELGIHCEGLVCTVCRCNARNRFFYLVLNRCISEINRNASSKGFLTALEASSYGYATMGDRYIELMNQKGVDMTCSDYYESDFKAVVKEDLSALSLDSETLDIICHSHVLEHVQDDISALKEAKRCLKPGGRLLVAVPVQTDYTFSPENEYHGDNAYVYRRNGWDIVKKMKKVGFHVEILSPPEHVSMVPANSLRSDQYVLDDIRFGDKFGRNYERYKELFYPACSPKVSKANRFSDIWGQLELFVAHKPFMS